MTTINITCDDPLHSTRSAEAGWANVLGTSDKPVTGYLCGACAKHAQPTAAQVNGDTLRTNAANALANNDTFLGTVAARRTNIATGKSTAQTGTSATVTTVAQAQTQIRSIWTTLVQVATALDDLNNQAEANTRQSNAVIRLLLNALDTTSDT